MTAQIAIVHPWLSLPTKRDLLLFDRIGIISLDANMPGFTPETRADLQWLQERQVIFDAIFGQHPGESTLPGLSADDLTASLTATAIAWLCHFWSENPQSVELALGTLPRVVNEFSTSKYADRAAIVALATTGFQNSVGRNDNIPLSARRDIAKKAEADAIQAATRVASQYVAATTGDTVCSLLRSRPQTTPGPDSNIVDVVIKHLPVPTEDVPLEAIIDFRADSGAMAALRRLRSWMASLSGSARHPSDLALELETLLDAYEEHMRLHKLKIERGALETLIVTAGAVVEDLAKVKLAAAAKSLFVLTERRIALLEAEQSAPGREVAYISRVRDRFSR